MRNLESRVARLEKRVPRVRCDMKAIIVVEPGDPEPTVRPCQCGRLHEVIVIRLPECDGPAAPEAIPGR